MATTFVAEYHGECAACGRELKGHEVTYRTLGDIIHVKCPESAVDVPAGVELCKGCWTYHRGECI